MNELFPTASVESTHPRHEWLRAHGLTLVRDGERWICALDDDNYSRGADEDEAIANQCYVMKIPFPAFLLPP